MQIPARRPLPCPPTPPPPPLSSDKYKCCSRLIVMFDEQLRGSKKMYQTARRASRATSDAILKRARLCVAKLWLPRSAIHHRRRRLVVFVLLVAVVRHNFVPTDQAHNWKRSLHLSQSLFISLSLTLYLVRVSRPLDRHQAMARAASNQMANSKLDKRRMK